jgi:hypothetical protein
MSSHVSASALRFSIFACLIDFRFGLGTWRGILEERARRIAEQKEAIKQAKIEKRKADAETWEDIKMVLLIMGIALAAIAVVGASIYYANMGQ